MNTITEPVKITGIIRNQAPQWTVGLIGSFNPTLYFMDLCNPYTGEHQFFDARAFEFEPAEPDNKPHVLRIMQAQREWQIDECAYEEWMLREALMFPDKDPRKA